MTPSLRLEKLRTRAQQTLRGALKLRILQGFPLFIRSVLLRSLDLFIGGICMNQIKLLIVGWSVACSQIVEVKFRVMKGNLFHILNEGMSIVNRVRHI